MDRRLDTPGLKAQNKGREGHEKRPELIQSRPFISA
jgi:hypothetical protein